MKRTPLIASVALVLGGFVVMYLYQAEYRLERSGGPAVEVVIAAQSIPFGEPVRAEWLATKALPQSYVEDRHILAPRIRDLIGLPLAQSVRGGEAILRTDLSALSDQQRTLSAEIPPGYRAITILASSTSTFNGLLRPGDHVDVILTVGNPLHPDELRNTLLFQNLAVLAIGRQIQVEETDEGRQGYRLGQTTSVTLQVTLAEGARLTQALLEGRLQLSLRNGSDVGLREAPLEFAMSDLLEPARRERYLFRDARRPRLALQALEASGATDAAPAPSAPAPTPP